MIPLFVWPIGALAGAWLYAKRRGVAGPGETAAAGSESPLADCDTRLVESVGWPYYFGRGSPSTPWADGPKGVDCSGYAQMALVRLGKLSSSASDRGVSSLSAESNPVEIGSQGIGDLALYGNSHVMVVCGPPRSSDGHSPVIGASSGGATTFGGDPNARVKLFDSALYWASNFTTYMRLK